MAFQVTFISHCERCVANIHVEEFNKYLSYVRNLGFEDTPDYDYLRDLFTQALKNTGEIEDGEYDWMKLNNGKGWEAMKQHPSAAHLNHGMPNSSQRELHGQQRVSKTPMTHERLNADLPKPGATRAGPQPVGRQPHRRDPGFNQDVKRQSNADPRAPEGGSTTAQFQHSTANLGQPRTSGVQPPALHHQQSSGQPKPNEGQPEEKWYQKMMKTLCCGK